MINKDASENIMQIYRGLLFCILIALAVFLCFHNLSEYSVQRWDEHTNIQVVRESLENGSLLELKYQGEAFFEKPPLWYWITMGVVKVNNAFFDNEASLATYRFISSFSGVCLVMVVCQIGKKMWGYGAGIIAGFSMLSAGHFFINNVAGYFSTHTLRSADLDALQILFIMLGFLCWIYYKESRLKRYLNLTFLFSGFAVMTKGVFGFLPIIILLLSHPQTTSIVKSFKSKNVNELFMSIWRIIRSQHMIPFSMLFFTILPWHLLMYLNFNQQFVDEYFIYHTIRRVTETIEGHRESWWFYVGMLFDWRLFAPRVLLPISILVMFVKRQNVKDPPQEKYVQEKPQDDWHSPRVFKQNFNRNLIAFPGICPDFKRSGVLAGFLMTIGVFTLIPTKLAWYNLYAYPFASLLIGYLAYRLSEIESRSLRSSVLLAILYFIFLGLFQNIIYILAL